jgi:hypothetical protein
VTLANSHPALTFLVLRACGTGLRAGKMSILRDFTSIDLRDNTKGTRNGWCNTLFTIEYSC